MGVSRLSSCKYFGGKSRRRLNAWLNGLIPYDKNGLYCEPFAGMLGVLLNRPPVKTEIVNDLDGYIYTFWVAIRDHYEDLQHRIENTFHCRQTYNEASVYLENGKTDDVVKCAWAAYVMIQNGMMHTVKNRGWTKRFACNGVAGSEFVVRIDALRVRMKHVQIENIDAVRLLDRVKDFERAVVYCDPPYGLADTSPYRVDKVDRERLSDVLQAQKGRVAVSGYGTEWDHLGWEKYEIEVPFVHVDRRDGVIGQQRVECLWTNYNGLDISSQRRLF